VVKLEKKEEIIKKATDLFYQYGFVKASIRNIATAIDISNSTVYHYFDNKDSILYYIIDNIGKDLLKELRMPNEVYDDPTECLREMIYRQVCLVKNKNKEIKIYIEEQYQLSGEFQKKTRKQHRQIYDLYHNMICQIKNQGNLHDVNETVATFSISAMMNWSYRWFTDNKSLSIEDVANDIITIFFDGILKK